MTALKLTVLGLDLGSEIVCVRSGQSLCQDSCWAHLPSASQAVREAALHAVREAWFRVWGLGFRIERLRFRVQGSGFRVQGSGFRVESAGCKFEGLGLRDQGSGLARGGLARDLAQRHQRCEPLLLPRLLIRA